MKTIAAKETEEVVEFTPENISDFRNCVTNNIVAAAQDRSAVMELVKFEKEFLTKAQTIQGERDTLKAEVKDLKAKPKKKAKK